MRSHRCCSRLSSASARHSSARRSRPPTGPPPRSRASRPGAACTTRSSRGVHPASTRHSCGPRSTCSSGGASCGDAPALRFLSDLPAVERTTGAATLLSDSSTRASPTAGGDSACSRRPPHRGVAQPRHPDRRRGRDIDRPRRRDRPQRDHGDADPCARRRHGGDGRVAPGRSRSGHRRQGPTADDTVPGEGRRGRALPRRRAGHRRREHLGRGPRRERLAGPGWYAADGSDFSGYGSGAVVGGFADRPGRRRRVGHVLRAAGWQTEVSGVSATPRRRRRRRSSTSATGRPDVRRHRPLRGARVRRLDARTPAAPRVRRDRRCRRTRDARGRSSGS